MMFRKRTPFYHTTEPILSLLRRLAPRNDIDEFPAIMKLHGTR